MASPRAHSDDASAVASVHLTGADAGGLAVLGEDDRVRLHVFADGEGKQHVGDLGVGRLTLGDDLQIGARDVADIAVLNEKAAGDGFVRKAWRRWVGQTARDEQAKVFLLCEHRDRIFVGFGRDDDFGEDFRDRFSGGFVQTLVQGDDAAKRGDWIAFQRALVSIDQ